MITGSVTPAREAVIHVQVSGSGSRWEDIEVVLDTGFDDALTLPPSRINALGLQFVGPALAMLADGSVVRSRYYRATVLWEGQQRLILVLEADSSPLAGMTLLYGSRVTVDVVDGGRVTIEPLP